MHSKTEWWSTFFSGIVLDGLDLYPEEMTRSDIDFLVKSFGEGPARILDVPCGNGRIALELAARGYGISGVDQTQESIDRARARARERGLEASFERRDMRDLPWRAEFDGAICFGNSFGYLDDEGNFDFLKAVAPTLKPGGKFILEAPLVAETVHNVNPNSWHQAGDLLMLRQARILPEEGRVETDYTFMKGGRTEKKTARYRVYTYRQLLELLRGAGFGRVEGLGSPAGEPFAWGSKALYFVATP